jgi:ferredoxin-NADP reductase
MQLILTRKRHISGNIWAFDFTPSSPLTWRAGQFIKVDLPHANPDAEGTARRFTIASTPHEGVVRIAARLTGTSFKQALAELEVGAPVTVLDLPAGDFVWMESSLPHVYIAQGVGITPFYAIVEDRRARSLPIRAHLIFTNHSPEDIPFKQRLVDIAKLDPTFQITFQTHPTTPDELSQRFPDLIRRIIYISGPRSLVALCAPPYNLPLGSLKQDTFPNYPAGEY